MSTRNMLFVGMAVVGMALSASAASYMDGVHISQTGLVTNDVPSGESVVQGRISVGDNVLFKTGAGKLTIPCSQVDQLAPLSVATIGGSVALDVSEKAKPEAAVLSDAVKAKILFWGAIDDVGHLKDAAGNDATTTVETWYDKRESNIAAPTYGRMIADHRYTVTSPTLKKSQIVRYANTETNAWTGLNFGGLGSGVCMTLMKKDGSAEKAGVRMAMAVHGTTDKIGVLFGGNESELPLFTPFVNVSEADTYLAVNAWGPAAAAHVWLDGVMIDGRSKKAPLGLHLVEVEAGKLMTPPNRSIAIFSNASSTSDATKKKAGGDDVCEYILFKTYLTENERLEVEAYLTRRWFPNMRPMKDIALQAGTTAEVTVADGETVSDANIRVLGSGELVKKGTGTYEAMFDDECEPNPAALRLEAGSVALKRLHPIAVTSGAMVDATYANSRNVITAAPGAADVLKKTGAGAVTLVNLPVGVKTLEVAAGQLTLGSLLVRKSGKTAWGEEVVIPNASFETWDNGDDPCKRLTAAGTDGWSLATSSTAVWFCNIRDWKTTSSASAGTTGTAFGLTMLPPDGVCAIHLKGVTAGAKTQVQIAKAGEYEFSCSVFGRSGGNSYSEMCGARITLENDAGETVTDFGVVRFCKQNEFDYENRATRGKIPAAGSYWLRIQNFYNSGIRDSIDCSLLFDDLHLRRLGNLDDGEWPLPNGDFEAAEVPVRCDCHKTGEQTALWKTFSDAYSKCTGWTFESPAGWTDAKPAVGLINPLMNLQSGRYDGDAFLGKEEPAYDGTLSLYFRANGGAAATTFRPPAGTWNLAAYLGNQNALGNSGTLSATVLIGGSEVSLGGVSTDAKRLTRQVWPNSFTVDGATDVTLTLSLSGTSTGGNDGIVADAFSLTRHIVLPTEELLPQGVLTSSAASGWTRTPCITSSGVQMREFGVTPSAFGTDHGEGSHFFELYHDGGFQTDVTLPCAGRYRLSFLNKLRAPSGSLITPTDVYLVREGETNFLDHITVAAKGVFEQRALSFTVAEAGTYTLVFKGSRLDGNCYLCICDVSIRWTGDEDTIDPVLDRMATVTVADGAMLRLDYSGSLQVERVKLGGRNVSGIINRATHPEFVLGDGSLVVEPKGFMLLFR